MKWQRAETHGVESVLEASFRQDLKRVPFRVALDAARYDLVRIVSQLTLDFERFELMVSDERHLLQQDAGRPAAFDDDEIRDRSNRIAVGAAEIATSVRGALDELWRLSRVTEITPPEPSERSDAREISEGQQAG